MEQRGARKGNAAHQIDGQNIRDSHASVIVPKFMKL
jgi:hypothetical protein